MSEKESEDKELATVNPSGIKEGKEITLEEVLPYFQKDFLLKSPFLYLIGGLAIHEKTKGDVDILIRLPEEVPNEIKVPLEFRLFRMFPDQLRDRVHFLYDQYGGPFTSAIEIADLKVEMRGEPRKVEMSLDTEKQRTTPGQKQTYNSPTFAYLAVYGKLPDEFLSGRTDHPQRTWNGVSVDSNLRDAWLEALNGIEGVEIRASCMGHSPERVSYVVFRSKNSEDDEKKAKEISKKLNAIEGCYSLADKGEAGKMRICVAGKTWHGAPGWTEFWEKLAGRIEQAVREEKDETSKDITNELSEECIEGFLCEEIAEEEFQRLHLEEFRSEGIDEDLRNPIKNFPLLLADLRYLGNSAFPKLKAGESWGEWRLEDVLRYFARIADTLRSKTSLPLLDTDEKGNKKNSSSWWKAYWESKKYMKTEAPSHDEAKEWNDRRRKLFEKPGEKKEAELESESVEEGGLIEEQSLVEEIREALDSEGGFPEEFRERAEIFLFDEILKAKFGAVGKEGQTANREAKLSQKENKIELFRRFYLLKSSISGLHAYRAGEVYSTSAAVEHLRKLHEKGIR